MTLSDKSIEAAADIIFVNTPPSQPREPQLILTARVLEAYFATKQSQGRDWQAIEALLPEIEEALEMAENSCVSGFIERLRTKLCAAMGKE